MILTVYRPNHDKRGLWSADEGISVPWLKDFMTKNKFIAILRGIPSAVNKSLKSSDPDYKVRECFKFLNTNFREILGLDHNLRVNEVVVSYYGRLSTKQVIR